MRNADILQKKDRYVRSGTSFLTTDNEIKGALDVGTEIYAHFNAGYLGIPYARWERLKIRKFTEKRKYYICFRYSNDGTVTYNALAHKGQWFIDVESLRNGFDFVDYFDKKYKGSTAFQD